MKRGKALRRQRRWWRRRAVILLVTVIGLIVGEWNHAASMTGLKIDRVEARHTIVQEGSRTAYEQLAAGSRPVSPVTAHYRVPAAPTVYLTFDDGPSKLTPEVLDILKDEGVQATFFVLGVNAERYPDTLQRIVDEGHAIGNHTYDHRYEELYSDFANFFAQVRKTDEIIYQTTGIRTDLLRAPGGTHTNFDIFYAYYLEQAGFTVYDWNVDSGDARRRGVPAEEIVHNVLSAPLKPQMHVLLHDSAGHEETVRALPEIIRYYKELGYRFAVLDPQVEPPVFTHGKLRWQRSTSWQDHLQHMERVVLFREQRASYREAATIRESLVMQVGGRRIRLEEEDYYVSRGRFMVALERFAPALGGVRSVDLPGSDPGRVQLWIAGVEVKFDALQKTMHIQHVDGTQLEFSNIHLRYMNGRLFVPLRGTVEALGGVIPAYSLDGPEKLVQVQMMPPESRSQYAAPDYMSEVLEHLRA